MTRTSPRSVVFITGTFIGNNCWDEWKKLFESEGYNCIAPCWPYKDGSPEELRNRQPDAAIALNRLGDLVDYFTIISNTLKEKPILIGHSFGGLIVQLLLQRNLGTVGIALHSFPPNGVGTLKFSFLKAWWTAMGFFSPVNQSYMIPFKKWETDIVNGWTGEEQRKSYYMYAIPESKKIIRETFNSIAVVNFNNPHPPLLLTSGDNDKMLPSALIYNNYKKYKHNDSTTTYVQFKNCNHLSFYSPVWREEAEFTLKWLQSMSNN